jgi:hypothetical protein
MVVHGAQAWFANLHSQVGLLPLPLRKFRVDGAQTPLTGYLPPPPHRMRVPQATGSMLQIAEPAMDGVRHEGPPAPPTQHDGSRPHCLQSSCGERSKRDMPRSRGQPLAAVQHHPIMSPADMSHSIVISHAGMSQVF